MIEYKNKWNLLASISNLYYNTDMTQNEIAETFYVSRSKVSRLIKEARELGVVEIKINEPWERNYELESEMKDVFNIERIIVLEIAQDEEEIPISKLGDFAAYYLNLTLNKEVVLGISWGNTIYEVVHSLGHNKNMPITVVPIMGAANMRLPQYDILELSKQLARAFGGKYKYIVTPLIVENKEICESLAKSADVKEALMLAESADVILTSVGEVGNASWKEYLETYLMEELVDMGAIGHIGGRFYDINGKQVRHELSERTISISLEAINQTHDVICVAGREDKAEAIYGALRGAFINTLITDERAVRKVLELNEQMCNIKENVQ